MHIPIRHIVLTTALAAGTIFACSGSGSSTEEARQGQGTDLTDGGDAGEGGDAAADADAGIDLSQPMLAVCSDGQAAAILRASGQSEIEVASSVLDRLEDPNVKAYAQRMITEHTAVNAALAAAVAQAGINVEDNDNSKDIQDATQQTIASLRTMSGSELDRSYIAHEVSDHLADLGTIDHLLMPSIKNQALLTVATQTRAAVSTHVQLAVQVQSNLVGQCGTPRAADGGADAGGGDAAADTGAGDAGVDAAVDAGGDAAADAGGDAAVDAGGDAAVDAGADAAADAGGGGADAGGGGTTMQ